MLILDATAGPRSMWVNKAHPNAVYVDLRPEVKPDIVCDDGALPFRDKVFDLIIFDPPHLNVGETSNMAKSYGHWTTDQIRKQARRGGPEFYRVLKDEGFLVFKWNDHDMELNRMLNLMPMFEPLFGQVTAVRTKHSSQTFWVTMIKRFKSVQATLGG